MTKRRSAGQTQESLSRYFIWRSFTTWQSWVGIVVMLLTVVTDRVVKIRTVHGFRANYGFVRWTLLHNYGAAGGTLSGHRVFLIVVGLIVMVFLILMPRILKMRSLIFFIGWGMALGGAVGNIWDRIVHGYVIDMFQMRHQDGVFNVSDLAIQFGLILMIATYLITELYRDRKRKRARTHG